MAKYLVGVAVLIILLGGGYYVWEKMGAAPTRPPPPPAPVLPQLTTYASSTMGISLTYPSDFTLDEMYAYDQFGPTKLVQLHLRHVVMAARVVVRRAWLARLAVPSSRHWARLLVVLDEALARQQWGLAATPRRTSSW